MNSIHSKSPVSFQETRAHESPRNALVAAAGRGDLQAVNRLVLENPSLDFDARDHQGDTALGVAILHGNLAVAERLLALGADPHPRVNGMSALRAAIHGGHAAVLQALLERDVEVNERIDVDGKTGVSLVMLAARWQPSLVRLLLRRDDIQLDAVDGSGNTALMHAVWGGSETIVKLVAARGGQIDHRNNEGKSAWRLAFESNSRSLMRVLLEAGAGIDQEFSVEDGATALTEAIDNGDVEMARWLLQQGADPNWVGELAWTPLREALWAPRSVEMMRLLLENGADARAGEDRGLGVLATAAGDGDEDAIALLMSHGACPTRIEERLMALDVPANRLNDIRLSALQVAVWQGHVDVLTTLAEQGYDLMTPLSRYRSTALHLAVQRGHHEMVTFLLPIGHAAERVNLRNDFFETPLMLAVKADDIDVVRFLLERGADANLQEDNGNTALHFADEVGNEDIADLLISYGADGSIPNHAGVIPAGAGDDTAMDTLYQGSEDLLSVDSLSSDSESLLNRKRPRSGSDADLSELMSHLDEDQETRRRR